MKKMNKIKIIAAFLIIIVIFCVCFFYNDKSKDEKKDELKTNEERVEETSGYNTGEVQEMSVLVKGKLYKQNSSTLKYYNKTEADICGYDNYQYYGSVIEENNKNIPDKELYSTRIPKNSKIYVNDNDDKDILIYINTTIYFLQKCE